MSPRNVECVFSSCKDDKCLQGLTNCSTKLYKISLFFTFFLIFSVPNRSGPDVTLLFYPFQKHSVGKLSSTEPQTTDGFRPDYSVQRRLPTARFDLVARTRGTRLLSGFQKGGQSGKQIDLAGNALFIDCVIDWLARRCFSHTAAAALSLAPNSCSVLSDNNKEKSPGDRCNEVSVAPPQLLCLVRRPQRDGQYRRCLHCNCGDECYSTAPAPTPLAITRTMLNLNTILLLNY